MNKKDFFNSVYEIVAKIPEGKVTTYGQIAMMLGSPYYARHVGRAMADAPEYLNIPCHRVVNCRGELAPSYAFGGAGRQKEMLKKEGVIFKENGCIDLKKCAWRK